MYRSIRKERRSRQRPVSCHFCRSRKLRCSRQLPCSNCSTREISCQLYGPQTPCSISKSDTANPPETFDSIASTPLQRQQDSVESPSNPTSPENKSWEGFCQAASSLLYRNGRQNPITDAEWLESRCIDQSWLVFNAGHP